MAVNKMAVSVETSSISIAELRSRFQKEEVSAPKSSPSPRHPRNCVHKLPSPSPAAAKPSPPKRKEPIATNNDITTAKLRLQKVLASKVVEAQQQQQTKKEDQQSNIKKESQTSRQVKSDESSVEEAVVPKVAIKPNRSHLSTLIVEVQQNRHSTSRVVTEADPVPPPLPPWIKPSVQVRLRTVPSLTEVGPPPSVPRRPPSVRLKTFDCSTPPTLPQRNTEKNLNSILNGNTPKVSSSPIPEYTEEQELGGAITPDDLYGDAEVPITPSVASTGSYSSSNHHGFEDLYQDSFNPNSYNEEVYEDVGNAPPTPARRPDVDLERERRKQLKEAEKKRREIKKSREKFGLTGNEVEVDVGTVKEDTRGKRKDELQAKAGERITVLKISGTPVGKWLVRNCEGKVGYMDLNNIEVNADSVRSVMRQTRITTSIHLVNDGALELYNDGHSEAIYEEFT